MLLEREANFLGGVFERLQSGAHPVIKPDERGRLQALALRVREMGDHRVPVTKGPTPSKPRKPYVRPEPPKRERALRVVSSLPVSPWVEAMLAVKPAVVLEPAPAPLSTIGRHVFAFAQKHGFTNREREAMVQIVLGAGTDEIAAAMGIERLSTKKYCSGIIHKVGVNTIARVLAAFARDLMGGMP